jgi:tetratricopeptide (TPR) repeat protein
VCLEESLRLSEALNHHYSQGHDLRNLAIVRLERGDVPVALDLLERARAMAMDAGYQPGGGRRAALARAYLRASRVAEALAVLRSVSAPMGPGQSVSWQSNWMLALAEAHLAASDDAEALRVAEQVAARTRETGEQGLLARALKLLGDIAARGRTPDLARAEAYHADALDLAGRLGMRPLVALCHQAWPRSPRGRPGPTPRRSITPAPRRCSGPSA